eukprot:Sdes_comp20108_c0_seq1m13125
MIALRKFSSMPKKRFLERLSHFKIQAFSKKKKPQKHAETISSAETVYRESGTLEPFSSPKIYIFGYGSLINHQSCLKTIQGTRNMIPVRVKGLQRSWNVSAALHSYTAVGVRPVNCPNTFCNGVLIQLDSPDVDIPLLDAREKYYSRIPLAIGSIAFMDASLQTPLHDSQVFTYVPTQENPPSKHFPIAQSYVDTIMVGCLQFGLAFVEEFVKNTVGWDNIWLNERNSPRYIRSSLEPNLDYSFIDLLLKNYLPELLGSRLSASDAC